MIDETTSEILRMITEMNSMHNDGWTRDIYHRRLQELKALIERGLKEYKP